MPQSDNPLVGGGIIPTHFFGQKHLILVQNLAPNWHQIGPSVKNCPVSLSRASGSNFSEGASLPRGFI